MHAVADPTHNHPLNYVKIKSTLCLLLNVPCGDIKNRRAFERNRHELCEM